MAYGKPFAIVARLPDSECIWPRRAGMCRAHHVAMVPLSQVMIASLASRWPSSWAITCGFIGVSRRVARSSISSFHSRIPCWAFSRKARSRLCWSSGSSASRVRRLSPTSPTSTG